MARPRSKILEADSIEATNAAMVDFMEAYLVTRREARVLLRVIMEQALNFLELEDRAFSEAAKKVKERAYPHGTSFVNGEDKDHRGK